MCIKNKFERNSIRVLFESTHELVEINVIDEDTEEGVQPVTLCHYPMISWNHSYRHTWNLHGHTHEAKIEYSKNEKDPEFHERRLNVGVDLHNYTPISYSEVKAIIKKQKELQIKYNYM